MRTTLTFHINGQEIKSSKKTILEQIIDILYSHDKVTIIKHGIATNYIIDTVGHGKYEFNIKVSACGIKPCNKNLHMFIEDVAAWILNFKYKGKVKFKVTRSEHVDYEKLMKDSRVYKRRNGFIKEIK